MIRKTIRSSLPALLLGLSSLIVAAAPDPSGSAIEQASLAGTQQLEGALFHVQGLALEPTRIWVTSIDQPNRKAYLHEFDRASGTQLRRLDLTDGARYHPGGISVSGGSIWVPVAELRPNSSATLVEIDTKSLKVRRKIHVPDHLGCVAASGDTLVAGNWDSKLLYVFDLSRDAPPRTVRNPSATSYQDIKFVGDQLVAGGSQTLWSGTLDWIDWPSMQLKRTLRTGAIGPVRPLGRGGPFTGEGMAIEGRDLYVLPEDGPSRLFRFRLEGTG
ncbi:DUF6454 family protein [Sphingomonas sp. M1-B02]|uniref:DUF6454 family protein n=1 Tax=Sphingomonas sp. M1-B02 TaxID=3114300 RepID=UPI00223F5F7E|nr:DUF6454 family protein [Sphingomonas sp. S6-11]UZK64754.1 DUF6454 family protein [Sphingomonas sp. S6-11]